MRKRDNECIDAFVRWYGDQLNATYALVDRPDETCQGAIDAVYEATDGSLVYVEHTSIDEYMAHVPARNKASCTHRAPTREISKHLALFQKRFREGKTLPTTGKLVVLDVPAPIILSIDKPKYAKALRSWYEQYAPMLPDDNRCYPTEHYHGPIPTDSLPIEHMMYSAHACDPSHCAVIIQPSGVSETDLENELTYVLDTNLSKLSDYGTEFDNWVIRRLLIIQNDEWSRGFRSKYIPVMQALAPGRDMRLCDEVWAFEMLTDKLELPPVLLWCREWGDERERYQHFHPTVVAERHEAWRSLRT